MAVVRSCMLLLMACGLW